ncbi:hypothetical protein PFISCL1PPCAC_1967, partial [Pristionchus fissidentatus]
SVVDTHRRTCSSASDGSDFVQVTSPQFDEQEKIPLKIEEEEKEDWSKYEETEKTEKKEEIEEKKSSEKKEWKELREEREEKIMKESKESENGKKKMKAFMKMERARDNCKSSLLINFSRQCQLCSTLNPFERVVYQSCGHISCTPCATQLRLTENDDRCPFCEVESRSIPLREEIEYDDREKECICRRMRRRLREWRQRLTNLMKN